MYKLYLSKKNFSKTATMHKNIALFMLASTALGGFGFIGQAQANPTTDTDSGIWRLEYNFANEGGQFDDGNVRLGCSVNPDKTFRIHEIYEHVQGSTFTSSYHRKREITSTDGVNYHLEEYLWVNQGPTKHVKTENWQMAKPVSCGDYAYRVGKFLNDHFFIEVKSYKLYEGADAVDHFDAENGTGVIVVPQKPLNPGEKPAPKQTRAVRQITGQGVAEGLQPGLRVANLGGQGAGQRLTSLSSKLAITDGQAAINRAALSGNPLGNSQTSLSLANQSVDAGNAGLWVSLSNNNPIAGAGQGATNHMQVGQDIAVSTDLTIGMAASHSGLTQSQFGDTPNSVNGDVIASNLYAVYSPGNLRLTAAAGLQAGSLQNYRFFTSLGNEIALGQTGFKGANGELGLGYELGKELGGKDFSLIPSFAVGHRSQTTASYNERATDENLALSVPELANKQLYAAVKLDARAVVKFGKVSALPMASIGVERDNSNLSQNGAVGFVADASQQLATNLGSHNHATAINYRLGLDLVGSDESGLALRADYQGTKTDRNAAVNSLSFGLKGVF